MVAESEKPIPKKPVLSKMFCSAVALSAAKVTSRLALFVGSRFQSLSAGPAKVTVTVSSAAGSPSRLRV